MSSYPCILDSSNTWVVFPSNLASSEWMVTWGIMFFSTASWNKGGGGKSIARNRNGETEVLESKQVSQTIRMSCETRHTAVDVELRPFTLSGIRPDHYLLCLQPQLALKGLENYTLKIRRQFEPFQRDIKSTQLEFFFFFPPRSLWS